MNPMRGVRSGAFLLLSLVCTKRFSASSSTQLTPELFDTIVPRDGTVVPIAAVSRSLSDDILESLPPGGLKQYFETRNDQFDILSVGSSNVLGVRRKLPRTDTVVNIPVCRGKSGLLIPKAPDIRDLRTRAFQPPQPNKAADLSSACPKAVTASTKANPSATSLSSPSKKKKAQFEDCWNCTTPRGRSLDADLLKCIEQSRGLVDLMFHLALPEEGNPTAEIPTMLRRCPSTLEVREANNAKSFRLMKALCITDLPTTTRLVKLAAVEEHLLSQGIIQLNIGYSSIDATELMKLLAPLAQSLRCIAVQLASIDECCSVVDEELCKPLSNGGRWQVRRQALLDPVVIERPQDFGIFLSVNPFLELPPGDHQASLEFYNVQCEHIVHDYHAFRLARFLKTDTFAPIKEVAKSAETLFANPSALLPQILYSYPQLFELDSVLSPSAVRYRVSPDFIPKDFEQPLELLQHKLQESPILKGNSARDNRRRIDSKLSHDFYSRLVHMKQDGIKSACDPDVAAHWLFDLLYDLEGAPETGLVNQLFPLDVQKQISAKSKTFLKRYPHLFHVVHMPPLYYLFRADLELPRDDVGAMSSDEEITEIVAAAVCQKTALRKSKPVLISSVQQLLPKSVCRRIGNFRSYLSSKPHLFIVEGDAVRMTS